MLKEINSRDNNTIKKIRSLQTRAGRKKSGLFFIEGTRIVDEALSAAPEQILFIVISKTYEETHDLKALEYLKNYDCSIVPDSLFRELSDTETPQGILAVMKISGIKANDFSFKEYYVLILDNVRDPGNIGTILRTAEAMGFDSIFLTKGCADIYSPKVLRSTMGSVFRIKLYANCDIADINLLKKNNYSIISTSLDESSVILDAVDTQKKLAVVIGSEADGVSKELLSISDIQVKIPMKGKTESLNAAVAAAIVMYYFSKN